MATLQDSEETFYKAIVFNIDKTLKEPIKILTHYTPQTTEQIVKTALFVYVEGQLADIIGDLAKSLNEQHINHIEKLRLILRSKIPLSKDSLLK